MGWDVSRRVESLLEVESEEDVRTIKNETGNNNKSA